MSYMKTVLVERAEDLDEELDVLITRIVDIRQRNPILIASCPGVRMHLSEALISLISARRLLLPVEEQIDRAVVDGVAKDLGIEVVG